MTKSFFHTFGLKYQEAKILKYTAYNPKKPTSLRKTLTSMIIFKQVAQFVNLKKKKKWKYSMVKENLAAPKESCRYEYDY